MKKLSLISTACIAASALWATSAMAAPIITQNSDANALAGLLIGSGITQVGDATLTGDDFQSGAFTNGDADVGMSSGVVLTSGDVNDIAGPNLGQSDFSTNTSAPGDADLEAIIGENTNDASVLEFDFQFGDGSTGGDIFFSFAFGSDEYLEFVDSFNDVFAFFVDGVNVALIDGDPISINNINDVDNSDLYIGNEPGTNNLDLTLDGLTQVITISVTGLSAGTHTMKFAIADALDSALDSVIFIAGGSFSTEPPVTGEVPLPAALPLMIGGIAAVSAMTRRRRKQKV